MCIRDSVHAVGFDPGPAEECPDQPVAGAHGVVDQDVAGSVGEEQYVDQREAGQGQVVVPATGVDVGHKQPGEPEHSEQSAPEHSEQRSAPEHSEQSAHEHSEQSAPEE